MQEPSIWYNKLMNPLCVISINYEFVQNALGVVCDEQSTLNFCAISVNYAKLQ